MGLISQKMLSHDKLNSINRDVYLENIEKRNVIHIERAIIVV